MIVKDLILQADEPYRTQMLENANVLVLLSEYHKLSFCLAYMFSWNQSPQGYKYWEKYYDTLIKQGL